MDKSEIEKLLEKATVDEKVILTTFYNGYLNSVKKYQQSNSASDMRDFQAAESALKQKVAELNEKYFKTEPFFDNIQAACNHLQNEGYKIKKSKMYVDRDKGLLRVRQDGTILESALMAYAAGLKRIRTNTGELEEATARKAALEARRIELDIEKREFDLEKERGLYIKREVHEAEISMRAGVLSAMLKNLHHTRFYEVIEMAGGDPKKTRMATDYWLDNIESCLDEYAKMDEIEVYIDDGNENSTTEGAYFDTPQQDDGSALIDFQSAPTEL